MPTTNSAQYQKLYVQKLPAQPQEYGGRLVSLFFKHVVGAGTPVITEASGDIVNLVVVPAFFMVLDMKMLSPDGGFGTATIAIGDAGLATRLSAAAVLTTGAGLFAVTGLFWRPVVDTLIIGTWGTAAPTPGRTLQGVIIGVPAT